MKEFENNCSYNFILIQESYAVKFSSDKLYGEKDFSWMENVNAKKKYNKLMSDGKRLEENTLENGKNCL